MRTGKVWILVVAVLALVLTPVLASASVVETVASKGKPVPAQGGGECSAEAIEEPCTVDLYAGQNLLVGTVSLTRTTDDFVMVTYNITDPDWFIVETHLYLDRDEAPPKSAPGQFPFKHEGLEPTNMDVYTPDELGWLTLAPGECLYVAAHAVVVTIVGYTEPDLQELTEALPSQVTMSVVNPGTGFGDPSYFDTTISGGTTLDGTYDAFCVDIGRTINSNVDYVANVYSSYDTLPDGTVDKPENLDLVNWVINQGYVGQMSPGGYGMYTYGDVQRAIWALIDNSQSTAGLGSWNADRVAEIVAAALASGEGFMPACGEFIAIILVPVNTAQVTIAQVTVSELQVTYGCQPIYADETAWGQGGCPFKQGWGSYFKCCRPEQTITVEEGEPAEKRKGFGDRCRSFGNTGADENYLGRGDLGVEANRAQRNFGYTPWGASNGITFQYDQENDKLISTVDIGNDGSVDFTLEYPNLTSQVAALGTGCTVDAVDVMILSVVGRDANTTVDFNNVILDGNDLGDFAGEGWRNWTVTGFDFTQGFTLTGDLLLSGAFGTSQELSKLEMQVGCLP